MQEAKAKDMSNVVTYCFFFNGGVINKKKAAAWMQNSLHSPFPFVFLLLGS